MIISHQSVSFIYEECAPPVVSGIIAIGKRQAPHQKASSTDYLNLVRWEPQAVDVRVVNPTIAKSSPWLYGYKPAAMALTVTRNYLYSNPIHRMYTPLKSTYNQFKKEKQHINGHNCIEPSQMVDL